MSIGGSSFNNGITFISNNYIAKLTFAKDNKYTITTEKRIELGRVRSFITKTPLIKGLFSLVDGNPIMTILTALLILSDFFPIDIQGNSTIRYMIFAIMLFALAYLAKRVIFKMKDTWRFHGAEHKTIYAYDSGMDLTLDNIRDCPRTARRCGTNLVVFMVLFYLAGSFLPVYPSIKIILPYILAYEVFDLDNGDKLPVINILFKFGHILQQYIFTLEPSDVQILASIEAIDKLIGLEASTE